ncbi:cysteine-rich receptor-like protein kinase 10 [Quercus robur]|uniref:cysteine-rich receptor-like protein kinase 10 n=1 Tax=Quercus robur TaxID=38942 RepID=UPI0021617E26|nr:cysteine-rich receptor-like protein kinase 10 [Quercus robur]
MTMKLPQPCRFNLCLTLLVLYFLISFLSHTRTEAVATYLYHNCPNTTTFIPNSTYQSNLNHLLIYLSSNATGDVEFYNATAGNSVDTVYGLFLCRGDLSADTCQSCIADATEDIVQRCPTERVAVGWYDECMLRYSDQYFFGSMVTDPNVILSNTQNISDQARFDQLVRATMNDLASGIINLSTGVKKFGTKQANFTALQNVYTLAQCTPDLSGYDCNRCLQSAIQNLPSGKQGGRVLFPSCIARFEIYLFYLTGNTSAPPPMLVPPPPTPKGKSHISSLTIIAIVAPIIVSVVLFFMGYCFLMRRKASKTVQKENAANEISIVESLQFDFATIEAATNKFSDDNKLGEGGFGQVYKGILPNGQEIAVKRLSRSSGQGAGEFKNEVVLVAKLQHRNLVRLLGFCLEGEEKILVYEFVPNKSLDYFLYEPERHGKLEWSKRYKIIGGIARGMLYLHEDSRLRIIHRDLKASNVLLDEDMSPKISDFGMAKIFGVDQTQGNTSRVVGTFGYMSPEYVMHGQFSTKSDVYSFGVLILVILSGKKNTSFYQSDGPVDLLSFAWKHWKDGTLLEFLDPTLADSYLRNEVIRCLHIGLLCVQENPVDRPTMASIVVMLNSYSITLPSPQNPAYFRTEQSMPLVELESDKSKRKSMPLSVSEASITEVYPR